MKSGQRTRLPVTEYIGPEAFRHIARSNTALAKAGSTSTNAQRLPGPTLAYRMKDVPLMATISSGPVVFPTLLRARADNSPNISSKVFLDQANTKGANATWLICLNDYIS